MRSFIEDIPDGKVEASRLMAMQTATIGASGLAYVIVCFADGPIAAAAVEAGADPQIMRLFASATTLREAAALLERTADNIEAAKARAQN